MEGRKVSLPPVLFHLVGQPLNTLLILEEGNSSRFGVCNVQNNTGSETVNHFTNMSVASKHPTFVVLSLTTLIAKMLYTITMFTDYANTRFAQQRTPLKIAAKTFL